MLRKKCQSPELKLRPVAATETVLNDRCAKKDTIGPLEKNRRLPILSRMDKRARLAVFLSGGGTTLQNLIDRIADGRLHAEIAVVISNNRTAHGLVRGERAGIPVTVVDRKAYGTREEFSQAMFSACREYRANLVCLAGFMQLIVIPEDFAGRVLNIHPALIPAFCGKGYYGHHVHEAVIASGAKVSGCTVHFADNQYDHGPIIIQRAVPVLDDDTPETLAERVFREECEAYPEAIRLVTGGHVRVDGRKVIRIIAEDQENAEKTK